MTQLLQSILRWVNLREKSTVNTMSQDQPRPSPCSDCLGGLCSTCISSLPLSFTTRETTPSSKAPNGDVKHFHLF